MKKTGLVLTAALFVISMLFGNAFAEVKIGYIDLAKTFSEYKKTKDFDKVLNDKMKGVTTERDKQVEDITKMQDKISLLNDKEKEAKNKELQDKIAGLKEFDKQKETDLRKERDDKALEISKDIESAINQYAEKEGFTYVFDDRALVYQNKSMEITNNIIAILNKDNKGATKDKKN